MLAITAIHPNSNYVAVQVEPIPLLRLVGMKMVILAPQMVDAPIRYGLVIGVGPGIYVHKTRTLQPMQVKEGDRVSFSKYNGNWMTVRGREYVLIPEDDLLVICNPLPPEIAP